MSFESGEPAPGLDPFGVNTPAAKPRQRFTDDDLAAAEVLVKETGDELDAAMAEAMRLKPPGEAFVPLRTYMGDMTPGPYGDARRRALNATEAAQAAVDRRAMIRAALAAGGPDAA